MDQSASVFSERGSALLVSFTPSLSARPVYFPRTQPELCFLVAQSFVTSNKQETGPVRYNLRVVECSMAAAYLNAKLLPAGTELPRDAGPLGVSLRGFHRNYFAAQPGGEEAMSMPAQLDELIRLTRATLTQEEGYTVDEIAAAMGVSAADVRARFLSSFPVRGERFKLRQRALHVFTEAGRVLQFLSLLEDPAQRPAADAAAGDTAEYNARLGALMNETQESCREAYECSCAETDELCALARGAGSYGSRLTGAGWGGCSVHLVPADRVDAVRKALLDGYYARRLPHLSARDLEAAIVVSKPMNGSAVVRLSAGGLH